MCARLCFPPAEAEEGWLHTLQSVLCHNCLQEFKLCLPAGPSEQADVIQAPGRAGASPRAARTLRGALYTRSTPGASPSFHGVQGASGALRPAFPVFACSGMDRAFPQEGMLLHPGQAAAPAGPPVGLRSVLPVPSGILCNLFLKLAPSQCSALRRHPLRGGCHSPTPSCFCPC